jgi:hypothetical protein
MLQTSLMIVMVEGCHPSLEVARRQAAWPDGPVTGLELGDVICRIVVVLPSAYGDVPRQQHLHCNNVSMLHAEVM